MHPGQHTKKLKQSNSNIPPLISLEWVTIGTYLAKEYFLGAESL